MQSGGCLLASGSRGRAGQSRGHTTKPPPGPLLLPAAREYAWLGDTELTPVPPIPPHTYQGHGVD